MQTRTATKAKVVRRTTSPSFRQLCAIVRAVITQHPTDAEADLKEAIKQRHVALGYLYSNDQIPRAMDAVEQAMGRYFLATPTPREQSRPPPEMAQQIDPPWRTPRHAPATWTRLRALIPRSNKRSARSM